MTKPALQLSVLFAHFPYGGNGGVATEIPQIRKWEMMTALKMKDDPRIGNFDSMDFSDTPIPMTRNAALLEAKRRGAHLCLMIDSDNNPLRHLGEPWHKPFWDEAFDFIYNNYHKGPRLVFAPYCGPPGGGENVYVFQWEDMGTGRGDEAEFKLAPYSRQEAARMTGIQEAAAGPTGLILIDLRLLDLIEPVGMPKLEVLERVYSRQMTPQEGLRALREGYFYYEFENQYASKKASTEDVTFTRDVSLAGISEYGYNPVFCAWDSWVGHQKPWDVGRPERYTAEQVNATLVSAALQNNRANEVIVDMSNLNRGNSPAEKALRALVEKHKVNGHEHRTEAIAELRKPWTDYGHAPPEHCEALATVVAQNAACKDGAYKILEVGSWLGTTAIAMADAAPNVKVHCVDTWEGTPSDHTGDITREVGGDAVYTEFCKRIGGRLNKKITPWRKTSADAAKMAWGKFDLIFIDADHTYEGVKADIEAWWPHLAPGGLMIGHDYHTKQFPGVTRAVEERFVAPEMLGWGDQGGMWLVRKEPSCEEKEAALAQ